MRLPLAALVLLVAIVATAVAVRPWSIARSGETGRCYATWPHTTGIYQLDTDDETVVRGVLDVERLDTSGAWSVPHTGGIVVVRDTMLGVTLLFGIEPAGGQIVRYTLDERGGGDVSTLSDRMVILSGLSSPEALTFDATGETACITYTHADSGVPMARCYRIARQASLLVRNGIDEWWTSVGYYPYSAAAATTTSSGEPVQSLSAIGFDAHARPLEHASRSLWIDHAWDTERRVMTRFPLVNDGSSTPESTEIYHDGAVPSRAQHLVWQFAADAGLYSVLSEEYDPVEMLPTVFSTAWTADLQPRIQRLSLDPATLGAAVHKNIAMWLVATLEADQLVDLQLAGSASLDYDRTAQAIKLGYAPASPSALPASPSSSPSRTPVSPSQTPLPSKIDSSPSRFPDVVLPSVEPVTSGEHTKVEEEPSSGRRRSLTGLWALFAVVPVCCCVVALVAVRKRRALSTPFVVNGSLHEKLLTTFSSVHTDTTQTMKEYDLGIRTESNLIPLARDSTQ